MVVLLTVKLALTIGCLGNYYKYFFLQVLGLSTNIQFLTDLAKHPEFEKGNVHTDFIPQFQEQLFPQRFTSSTAICQAAMALVLKQAEKVQQQAKNTLGK